MAFNNSSNLDTNVHGAGQWQSGTVVREIEGHFNQQNEPQGAAPISATGGVPEVDYKFSDKIKDELTGGRHSAHKAAELEATEGLGSSAGPHGAGTSSSSSGLSGSNTSGLGQNSSTGLGQGQNTSTSLGQGAGLQGTTGHHHQHGHHAQQGVATGGISDVAERDLTGNNQGASIGSHGNRNEDIIGSGAHGSKAGNTGASGSFLALGSHAAPSHTTGSSTTGAGSGGIANRAENDIERREAQNQGTNTGSSGSSSTANKLENKAEQKAEQHPNAANKIEQKADQKTAQHGESNEHESLLTRVKHVVTGH